MPPIDIRDEVQHETTVVFKSWILMNPGNFTHRKAAMEAFLRGKGVPDSQVFKDGKPQHPLTAEVIE
jgi:hypothetical protein